MLYSLVNGDCLGEFEYRIHRRRPAHGSIETPERFLQTNAAHRDLQCNTSFHIRRRKRLNNTRAIHEPRPKYAIRIRKHSIFQTDNDKLTAFEPRPDQAANILRMREIECCVDFVQDIHWRRRVLEEG